MWFFSSAANIAHHYKTSTRSIVGIGSCHRSYMNEYKHIMLILINQFISQFLPSVGYSSINLSYPVWGIPVVCIPHVHHYNSTHYHRQCPKFHPYRSLLFLLCWLVHSSDELHHECSHNCELLTDVVTVVDKETGTKLYLTRIDIRM